MNILDQANEDLQKSKARVNALSSPITRQILAEHPDYWLHVRYNYETKQTILSLEKNHHITPGSEGDISETADDTNGMCYYSISRTILYRARTWHIERYHTYSQKFTKEELEILRAIGKIQTYISTYDSLTCS